jgi:hypothetical protein
VALSVGQLACAVFSVREVVHNGADRGAGTEREKSWRPTSMSASKNALWFKILLYAAFALDALSVALHDRGTLNVDVVATAIARADLIASMLLAEQSQRSTLIRS